MVVGTGSIVGMVAIVVGATVVVVVVCVRVALVVVGVVVIVAEVDRDARVELIVGLEVVVGLGVGIDRVDVGCAGYDAVPLPTTSIAGVSGALGTPPMTTATGSPTAAIDMITGHRRHMGSRYHPR